MKFVLPIILVAATVVLMTLAIFGVGQNAGTVGIATGSALPGLGSKADTPEQAIGSFLTDIRRRNWDRAYSALSKTSGVDEPSFIQDWTGSNGSPHVLVARNLRGPPAPCHLRRRPNARSHALDHPRRSG